MSPKQVTSAVGAVLFTADNRLPLGEHRGKSGSLWYIDRGIIPLEIIGVFRPVTVSNTAGIATDTMASNRHFRDLRSVFQ